MRWSKEKIWEWYNSRQWMRGCNYMSADCANRVDQWQELGFEDRFKTTEEELKLILTDSNRPILVFVDENDEVLGYCFCIYQQHKANSVLTDIKTLYIDDLCVEETQRGKRIGKELYEAAVKLARDTGCYNLTLNVWSCNTSAMKFYESLGLTAQKVTMETIL